MRYTAEIMDQMQFFFQEYNDHQLHCAIIFANHLDGEGIKKAVALSMATIPILRSRYIEKNWHPYWESIDTGIDDVVTLIHTSCIEKEVDEFLTSKTQESKGPQLMVRIVRSPSSDVLCIVMNHMVCDGAGLKEYLYLLSSIYTNVKRAPDYVPEYCGGSRSLNQIYKRFNFADRLKIFFTLGHLEKHDSGLYFPLSDDAERSPFILTYKLPGNRFSVLKEYSKKYHVTINDIVLAAYLRALCRVLEIKSDKSLAIPCAIDLRRFLPEGRAEAICNLTSTLVCDIGPDIGKSFEDTVIKVSHAMGEEKNSFSGLSGFGVLGLIFKVLPYSKIKRLAKKEFVNPLIGMTNIGVIDNNKLSFGGIPILDAFVTGSIKYPPYFQLALTTFNDTITFSINLYGTECDRERINDFFGILNDEVPAHIDRGI